MPANSTSRRAMVSALALSVALFLAACVESGSPTALLGGGASGVSYTSSNVFKPTGFNETRVDDTHFQVRATGDAKTTPQRLQKMALARAAEIGVEEKLDWFKVEGTDSSFTCGKKVDGYKGTGSNGAHLRTAKLTVAYAKTQADPAYHKADTAFAAAKADLDADTAAPEAVAAAEQELKQACGR